MSSTGTSASHINVPISSDVSSDSRNRNNNNVDHTSTERGIEICNDSKNKLNLNYIISIDQFTNILNDLLQNNNIFPQVSRSH